MPDRISIPANKQILQSYINSHPGIKKSNEPVNTGYLAKDLEIINGVINKIPKLNTDFNEYVKILPSLQSTQNIDGVDAGFGLFVSNAIIYGGYGNFTIRILHYKNDVLSVNVDIYFSGMGHEFIRDEIIDHIDFPIECSEYGIFYAKSFENKINEYQKQKIFSIRFKPTENTCTKQDLENYQILSNPTTSLMWGRKCGYTGEPPHGRIEMDNLVNSKKYQLVEDILYSANVVGRIYALQALEKWELKNEYALTKKTKDLIEKIKDLEIKFDVCDNGCMVIKMSYKELANSKSLNRN